MENNTTSNETPIRDGVSSEDRTNQNTTQTNITRDFEELAHECILGRYVLIVGSECILDPNIHNGDSLQWLINKTGLRSMQQEELNGQLSDLEVKIEEANSNEEIARLEEEKTKVRQQLRAYRSEPHPISDYLVGKDVMNVKRDMRREMENYVYTEDSINPQLLKLLETRCFRVIITTAIDKHLETALRRIWGNELKVLNINSCTKKDWDTQLVNNEFCDAPPTLYYAFGCLDNETEDDFVLSEDDAMRVINKWGNDKPTRFGNYISNKSSNSKNFKYILSMGCQLDNWQFRFFWYQLLGEHLVDRCIKARVAMTWDDNLKLRNHIENFWNFSPVDNTQEFINNLCRAIHNKLFIELETNPQDYVFISYAHQDQCRAYNLALLLKEKGISVWIDSKLGADGLSNNYTQRIHNAINNCKVFLPLFTHETSECLINKQLKQESQSKGVNSPQLMDNDFTRYFFYEWYLCDCQIKEKAKISVIPVVYSGFVNSETVQKEVFEECFKRSKFETNRFSSLDLLVEQIKGEINLQNQP